VSAEVEPSSSLPSPPASSPPPLSPDGETVNSSGAPASSPDHNASQTLPNVPQQLSTNVLSRPDTPTMPQHLVQPTENRQVTPTFASLSSPTGSPALPAVPGSPPFDSLVYEAVNGKRKREDEHFSLAQSPSSQLHNSQESQNSLSSSGSQDSVEKQLTQSLDDDAEYSQLRPQITQSQPEELDDYTSAPAQTDQASYKGELQWMAESSQVTTLQPRSSQATSHHPLAPLQTQLSTMSMGAPSTPVGAVHTPTTSVQKQAWYGTLPSHSHKKRKSRQNSGLSLPNVHQSAAAAGFRVSKPSAQINSTQVIPSSPGATLHPSVQPMTPRPLGNVFLSGTLQTTPTTAESVRPEYEGNLADDAGSQSQLLIGWSQTQTQTSWLGHASYPPLQTQAPYQSQGSSSQ